jgi:hypothetical protein
MTRRIDRVNELLRREISTVIQLGIGFETAGINILPRYTPSGRYIRPPPASTTAFRHAEKASVLSVLSSSAP